MYQNDTLNMKTEVKTQTIKQMITEIFEKTGAKVTSVTESQYGGKTIYTAEIKPNVSMVLGNVQLARLARKGMHVFGISVVPYGNHEAFSIEFMNYLDYNQATKDIAKSCGDE